MKTSVLIFLPCFIVNSAMAQQSIVRLQMVDGVNDVSIDAHWVDTLISTPLEQKVQLSFPNSEISSLSYTPQIGEDDVDLHREDHAQSDNLLRSISFFKADNSFLPYDIRVDALEKQNLKVVLPPLADISSLVPVFDASATFIFVDGKRWGQGNKVDFPSSMEIKLVAFNGDVRSYSLQLMVSENPMLSIHTNGLVGKAWVDGAKMKLGSIDLGTVSIKGTGNHYADNLKNNFRIKFETKKSLLEMTKNKRWVLSSLDGDKSLMRVALSYKVASYLSGLKWTPNYRWVDFSLNDSYLGTYLLQEQVRVCRGRVEDGFVVSIQDSYDEGDDFFHGEKSHSLFVMKDPETGLNGAGLLRTKDKIDEFERALFSSANISSMVDMQSFVDYYLVNEIVKDEEAFLSDCYMNVREDGVIAMGPVWNLNKSFGYEGVSPEGFIRDRSPWFAELSKSSAFMTLLKNRFAEIYAKKVDLFNLIDEWSDELLLAEACNDGVWKSLDAKSNDLTDVQFVYQTEIASIKQWIELRLEWMKSQLE